MSLKPSCLRVKAIAALALILSLAFSESAARSRAAASGENPGSQGKKKESNVDRGERVEKPPVQPVSPQRMNLKYRIFKRASDGHAEETNPDSPFIQGDRIQIKIRPSRPGYLYIIQSEVDRDGELIFPHSRISVQNLLTATREHEFPGADCDKKYKDEQGVCWLTIRSATGRVWLTMYFSPSQTDRPFTIQPEGKVSRQEILNIRNSAAKEVESGRYGRQVTAARNSKAVAAKIDLNHETSPTDVASQPSKPASPPSTGSSGTANPTNPPVATPPAKPAPAPLWGKLEVELDSPSSNGMRVMMLKATDTGTVSFGPLDSAKTGDRLWLDFYSNFDAYVYVLHVSPLGRTSVVFPDTRDTKKIKANYRTVARMKRLALNVNEKGVHTLQVVMAVNRVSSFEEAIEKKSGQLNPVSAVGQQARELGFDCASFLNLVPGARRAVSLASDASPSQASALAVVVADQPGSQPGASPEHCRSLTADQVKGDKIKGPEAAVFEIRFKQV